MASVGLIRDGGVFVAPAPVRSYRWQYAITRTGESPRVGEHFWITAPPKLHYHRSGLVSVSLTGTDIERCSLTLSPLPTTRRTQVLSVVSHRLWEFESKEPRSGDVFSTERRWPESVAFSFSVISVSAEESRKVVFRDHFPIGLLRGDARRFVVDMSAYGWPALLVGSVQVSYESTWHQEPNTTVAAFRWSPEGPAGMTEALALWTSELRNPYVHYESESDLVTASTLREPGEGTFTVATLAEQIERGNISPHQD